MPDLAMSWAGDLFVSPTGDLAAVDGPDMGTARVLRRLLTNAGDYIWNPTYGAGLAQYVGELADAAGVRALILAQMQFETAVSQMPEPTVGVQSDALGHLYASLRYVDTGSASSTSLSFSVAG